MTIQLDETGNPTKLYTCPGCYRTIYPFAEWNAMTSEQRVRDRAVFSQDGHSCSACSRAGRVEPEPGAEWVDPECSSCRKSMVSRRQWRNADAEERAELLAEGYDKPHQSGLCSSCRVVRRNAFKNPVAA